MSELIPITPSLPAAARRGGGGLSRRDERRLHEVEIRGLESALKVQAMAFVAHTALTQAIGLSALEESGIKAAPLGEHRYAAIVDSFAVVASNKLQRWA